MPVHLAKELHVRTFKADVQTVMHLVILTPIFAVAFLKLGLRHRPEVGEKGAICRCKTCSLSADSSAMKIDIGEGKLPEVGYFGALIDSD